jgi:acetyltransferase-like isoleucine patch superfamily enzyme
MITMDRLCALYAVFLGLVNKIQGKDLRVGKGVRIHPFSCVDPDTGKIILGEGTIIHRGAILKSYRGSVTLGKNVSVNPYSILYGHGGLTIGNDVRIAAHAVIIPANHVYEGRATPIYKMGETRIGITIEDDVWIAAGVKVLDDTHIAKGCVIGANAVIKGKTDEYGIYVGIPAKKIKER